MHTLLAGPVTASNHPHVTPQVQGDAADWTIPVTEVRSAMRLLPTIERSCVALATVHGLDNAEIAVVLGLEIDEVLEARARGLVALRRLLGRPETAGSLR